MTLQWFRRYSAACGQLSTRRPKSLTAKDATVAEEGGKSFTAKTATDAKEGAGKPYRKGREDNNNFNPKDGREDNAKGVERRAAGPAAPGNARDWQYHTFLDIPAQRDISAIGWFHPRVYAFVVPTLPFITDLDHIRGHPMLRPQGKPTAREVAQGFLISLESENPLTDLERSLIDEHGIDENKYRWEARYLEVAATQYAFYSLREGKFADRVAAVRGEYWKFWQELASKGGEGAFVASQLRARLETYGPALDKDVQGSIGVVVSSEFAHQFDPIPDGALPSLIAAGTAVFDGTFYSITEVLVKTDIKL